jgi:hypothetical protein
VKYTDTQVAGRLGKRVGGMAVGVVSAGCVGCLAVVDRGRLVARVVGEIEAVVGGMPVGGDTIWAMPVEAQFAMPGGRMPTELSNTMMLNTATDRQPPHPTSQRRQTGLVSGATGGVS